MTTATVAVSVVSKWSARVTVTVADAALEETMSVYRETVGSREGVLGGVGIPALSTVLTDPLPSLNQAVRWVVVLADRSEIVSEPVTIVADLPVLTDPWAGVSLQAPVVEVDDELVMRSRVEVITIEGDADPVAIGDVPTGYYGRLVLLTVALADAAAVRDLSRQGRAMLLRCSCGLHPDRWVRPTGDLTTARLVRRPDNPHRLHSWDECIFLAGPPWPGRPAAGDTLGDLAVLVPGDLGDIETLWDSLGEIAASDLVAGGL